jgi:hypothetical protein
MILAQNQFCQQIHGLTHISIRYRLAFAASVQMNQPQIHQTRRTQDDLLCFFIY